MKLLLFVLVSFLLIFKNYSKLNFQLRNFELCNRTQGFFTFGGGINIEDNILKINASWHIKLPLDDKIGILALIESKVTKTLYVNVFTIHEKSLCKAVHTYLGELWFDLEREVGIPEGICPIPANHYQIRGHEVDFKKMKLQTFPYGTLRATLNLVDNLRKDRLLTCLLIEIENVRK